MRIDATVMGHRTGRSQGWRLAAIAGLAALALLVIAPALSSALAQASPEWWKREGWKTDFSRHSVEFGEIMSGGPPRDGIPPIDDPKFVPVAGYGELSDDEPVIGLEVNGAARAYPLRVLTWHEIVNDTIGGVPVAVTYCPLCNAAIVFGRTLDGRVLDFGTTGKLRNSDLVMYDRQTESWWQQFVGEAIVGELMGKSLEMLPARLEAWRLFRERNPAGEVLVPNDAAARPYGRNPYARYDTAATPFLYDGEMPEGIAPMERVVVIEVDGAPTAVALRLISERASMEVGGVTLSWKAGQNSALDTHDIAKGRDVGNVVAQWAVDGGAPRDVRYDVTFAFVYHAFHPKGRIIKE